MTTNCVFPPELEDKQLLAHLDDPDADPEITRHLENCPHCREKAENLDRLEKHLTARLYRATCPPSMELGEYHLRMLPAPQMLVVAQHVRECPHCTREVVELQDFLIEGMPAADNGIVNSVNTQIKLGTSQSSALTPAFTFRGETKSTIHIEAGGIHIWVVDVQPATEGRVAIQCQVVDEDEQKRLTGALVDLQQEGKPILTTALDDYGQFSFSEARPGSFKFTIRLQDGKPVNFEAINIPL